MKQKREGKYVRLSLQETEVNREMKQIQKRRAHMARTFISRRINKGSKKQTKGQKYHKDARRQNFK